MYAIRSINNIETPLKKKAIEIRGANVNEGAQLFFLKLKFRLEFVDTPCA